MGRAQATSDMTIQQEVLRALRHDARLTPGEVGVAVRDGVVTLSGTVSSAVTPAAVRDAAHRVAAVRDVVDDLAVKTPGAGSRTGPELARVLRQALEWDPGVPAARIGTTVTAGHVTLLGLVDHLAERAAAEHAAWRVIGVRGVSNLIAVRRAGRDRAPEPGERGCRPDQ